MGQSKDGFYHELLNVLKQDSGKRFYADNGDLLRNKVAECAMNLDNELIKLLLSNERVKNRFFTNVNDLLVFDKMAFVWAINNKAFLKDSYTRFKNNIGLVDSNEQFISSKNDVVLSFPYKDCVLEGGQTKEDQKREEIYYNELLAPDDIDRLLAPKVFTNAKRYTKNGEENITEFDDEDNLLIKGNNLLALSAILKRYEGKVKCIYIDPPYNTGNDSFKYNDNFNHSTWLTFMKNRLQIAKKLLRADGVIFVQCDDNEQAYLKVLMDEIYKPENFISNIVWKGRGGRQDSKFIAQVHETIIVFAKSKNDLTLNRNKVLDKSHYPFSDENGIYKLQLIRKWGSNSRREDRPNLYYGINFENETIYPVLPNGEDGCWRWSEHRLQEAIKNKLVVKQVKDGKIELYEKIYQQGKHKEVVYNSWFDESFSGEGAKHLMQLFNDKVFDYPKPENLLKKLIEMGSDENDIVVDFHIGTGTTATTAHKLNRQWIAIEQMEYINSITVERIKKVLSGEQGGISQDSNVNWQGGGSFVYCELKELNQKFVDKIKVADDKRLNELYKTIINSEFISYKAEINKLKDSEQEFEQLSIDDKKKFLIEVLDKNMLYVNYCDIDDNDFEITEQEKAFTKSFYGDT